MKEVMSSFHVLALLYFSQPFVLECDASGNGIGAVLMHNKHPIVFENKNLCPHERLYSVYDTKMLVIMHALFKL